jgi:uncharacterized DUF497 family protein
MFLKGYISGILTVFAACTAITTAIVIISKRKGNKK